MTIYTDNAATTRMSDTAVAAMLPHRREKAGKAEPARAGGEQG